MNANALGNFRIAKVIKKCFEVVLPSTLDILVKILPDTKITCWLATVLSLLLISKLYHP